MATTDHFLSVFCRRRNVFATEPPKNDWLRWLTNSPTIRRGLLLRWVCRLWWMSGARTLSTLYATGLVRSTTPPPGNSWFRDVEDYRWTRNPCSALWVCLVDISKSRTRSIMRSRKRCSPVCFLGWNPCRTRLYWQIRCRPWRRMEMFSRWSYSCTSSQLFSRRPLLFAQATNASPSWWMIHLYYFIFLQSFGSDVMCKVSDCQCFRCFFPFLDFWCGNLFALKFCVVQADLKNVKNMNWCKFIADFLHDAFSSKMYQKGCRLHLMVFFTSSFCEHCFLTHFYSCMATWS